MPKTTVMFLIDVLQDLGGAEKNVIQLSTGLNPDKYNVIVACLKSGAVYEQLKAKNINVIDLKINRIYGLNAILKAIMLIRLIKKEKVKIAVTYLESSDFWGSIVARLAGVPVVISSRRDLGFNLKKRHILAYKIINRLFSKIIAVCDGVKKEIINREKVNPEKIITIHNGVDIFDVDGFDKERIKKSLGLDSNKLIVTMLANLTPIKGHKYLLGAAPEVIKNNNSVQFLLVGASKNGYREELESLVNKLRIKNNVVFAGVRPDIPQVLSISDVCVLPSTTEGFSNAILEYMSAGKPVVATDVGGNKELIIEGDTGYLIPPFDSSSLAKAALRLLNDSNLRNEMGARAKLRVKESFARDKAIKNVEALFESLC